MASILQLSPALKILLSANTSWYLVNFRSGLIKELIKNDVQVVILSPRDRTSQKLKQLGCRLVDITVSSKGTNLFSELGCIFRYLTVFLRERPNYYFGFTVKPVIYGGIAARLTGAHSIPTITGLGTVFIRPTWITVLVMLLYRLSFVGVKKVFFQNKEDKRIFVGRGAVKESQVEVVAGSGVDLRRFSYKPLDERGEKDVPIFLMIGRILGDKGVSEYVEAAWNVRQNYPQTRFQLLGPTDVDNETAISSEQVEQWAREGTIEYVGTTDNVVPYIENADCVVLPSYREGIPRALLEGAAIGRPLLAASSVGCVDVVEDGVNGYLCEPKSARDLASKMVQIINSPIERLLQMGLAGREKVEKEFDEREVIKKYLAALL